MAGSGTNKLMKIAVLVGMVVVIAGLVWFLGGRGDGGPSGADEVSGGLPDSVMMVVWSMTAGDALGLLEEVGINGEFAASQFKKYQELHEVLGVDLLTIAGLQALGIDVDGVPAFAMAPATESKGLGIAYVPMMEGRSGIDEYKKLAEKLGVDQKVQLEETEAEGHRVAWVVEVRIDRDSLLLQACEHAIMLMQQTDEGAHQDGEPAMEGCLRAFNDMPNYAGATAARCALGATTFEAIPKCFEAAVDLDSDDDADEKAAVKFPETRHIIGAFVEVPTGFHVVFPVSHRRRKADEIASEIKSLVGEIVDSKGKKLSSVDGYKEAVKGSGGALVGVYVNTAGAAGYLQKIDELAFLATSVGHLTGIGAWVKEEGNSLFLETQTVAKDADTLNYLKQRDTSVIKLIPGQPFFGLHMAVDAPFFMQEFEKGLAVNRWMRKDWHKGKAELAKLLNLEPGTEAYALWNGELGFFMRELSADPQRMVRSIVAFAGVTEVDKVKSALDALVAGFGESGMISADKIGDSDAYRIMAGELTVGVMIHNGRLWFAGDWDDLGKIARGEDGGMMDSDRNKKIAAVMNEDNTMSIFMDIEKPIAFLPTVQSKRQSRKMETLWPFLSELDYLSHYTRKNGRVAFTQMSLHLKNETFRTALMKLIKSAAVVSLDKYSRRTKTTEVIDTLDKIYKGAAVYYTTPRVNMKGEKLPCQFPADVPLTPASTCCAEFGGPDKDGDGRCDSNWEQWDDDSWQALTFQMTDQHYCVYSFDWNEETGANALFTANAHCDLDCDGVMSTFQRYGKGDPSSTMNECSIISAAAMFVQNELE